MLRIISRSVGAAQSEWQSVVRGAARLARDVRGVTAIEFAIIAPVLLTIVMGMLKFGVYMSHSLTLTVAATQGAQTLALSRGSTTPYAATTTAIANSASGLASAQITTTITINGTACTTNATCIPLMVAGQTAVVRLTYPCDMTVMGINYKPGPGGAACTQSAQTAQMIQ